MQTGDVLLKLEDTSAMDVECSLSMDDLYWLWSSTTENAESNDSLVPHPVRQTAGTAQPENEVPGAPDARPTSFVNVAANDSEELPHAGTRLSGSAFEIPAADAIITCKMSGRSFRWDGKLTRYAGHGVNRKTRTVSCRITVANPLRADAVDGPPVLMRGMYVTVTLNVTPRTQLWRIPNGAVQPNGQVYSVSQGVLRIHTVQPLSYCPTAS